MHDDDTHPPAPPPPPPPGPPTPTPGPDQGWHAPEPSGSPPTGRSQDPQWQQPQWQGQPQPYGQPQWQQPPAPGQYDPRYAQPAAQPYLPGYVPEGWIPEFGVRVASAGNRIGAKAIDIVIWFVISIVVSIAAAFLLFSSGSVGFAPATEFGGGAAGIDIGTALALAAITILVDFLYNVVCTAQFGGTPGKLMLGLRVIRTDGRKVDMAVAFRRWLVILILLLLGSVPGDPLNPALAVLAMFAIFARLGLLVTNLIMVLTDERRRSVFDRVASTYVITTK